MVSDRKLRGCRHFIVAVAGLVLAGQCEQGWANDKEHRNQQQSAQPSLVEQVPDPKNTDSAQEQCYPGSEPGVSCNGIAAKAAVDQVGNAHEQAALAWWQFGVGVGTFLAAIGAAFFAGRAAHHTKKQVDAIRAQVSLLPSNFTLEAILNQFKISGSSFPPSRPNVSLQFQNSGNSGAYIASIRAVHEIGVSPSDDPPFPKTPEIHFSDQTIAANDVSENHGIWLRDGSPTVADITEVQNGNFAVFFYGIIKYRDIFGEDHETAWCMRSEPDGIYRYWGGPTRNYRT